MHKRGWWWLLGVVAIVGCGRTREPAGSTDAAVVAGDATTGTADASWPASACPGATDVANVAIVPQQHVNMPHLVRAGARTGILWTGTTATSWEMKFAWLDDALQVVPGTTVTVSPDGGGESFNGRSAWSGSELGVVYSDAGSQHIFFVRLDASGAPIAGSEVALGNADQELDFPTIAWDPIDAQWGVAWQEWNGASESRVWFERIDARGVPVIGSTISFGDAQHPAVIGTTGSGPLVWAGTHWALAWLAGSITISEIPALGGPVHDIATPAAPINFELDATIAWDGAHYLLGWIRWQDSAYRTNVALFDAQGIVPDTQLALGTAPDDSAEPALAWTGSQFVAAFRVSPAVGINNIWTAAFDATGALVPGSQRALTCDHQLNGYPEVSPGAGELDISYAAQDPSGNTDLNTPEVNDLRVLRVPIAQQQ